MAKQLVTLYVVKHSHGGVEICNYKLHTMDHLECILIDTKEIEVEYADVDTRAIEIEALEKKVQLERAESQSRVNFLLERISKLKAIGHDSSVVEG